MNARIKQVLERVYGKIEDELYEEFRNHFIEKHRDNKYFKEHFDEIKENMMANRTTVTVHENDMYTVDEEKQTIRVSDQAKALYGEKQSKVIEQKMVEFLENLTGKWYVNVNFSKELG